MALATMPKYTGANAHTVTVRARSDVPRLYLLVQTDVSGWRLDNQIELEIEQDDDGEFIASDKLFGIYGEGTNANEAVRDYVVSLIDYYELLAARSATNSQTRMMFRGLCRYLQKD